MATGITFMGDDSGDVQSAVESAEAPRASVSHDGPIDSPVPDSGSTMNTSDQQDYGTVPSESGKGSIEFTDIESTK